MKMPLKNIIYESMDAYSSESAFTTGLIGMIFIVASFILKTSLTNISAAFLILGFSFILVAVFKLGIYPIIKHN